MLHPAEQHCEANNKSESPDLIKSVKISFNLLNFGISQVSGRSYLLLAPVGTCIHGNQTMTISLQFIHDTHE